MNLIQLSNAVDAAEKTYPRALVAVQHGDHFYLNTAMGSAVEIIATNPACEVRRVHIRNWDSYVMEAFTNNFGGAFDRLVVC